MTPVDTGIDAMRAIGALVAVAVVLAGFLWLLKRGSLAGLGGRRNQHLSIEGALPLGDRRSLVIVRVEGRRLLVGVAPAQVSLIIELEPTPPAFAPVLDRTLAPSEDSRS